MFDENLQSGVDPLRALIENGMKGSQALLLSAFVEDKKRWEDNRLFLSKELNEQLVNSKDLYNKSQKESKIKKFIYNRILRRSTPVEKKYIDAISEIDLIAHKILKHDKLEPNLDMYELAAMGNNLFSPR